MDFDGTLLGSDKTIGVENREILIELGQKGYARVIATGRSYYSFLKAAEPDLPVDYVIFSTGAGVMLFGGENKANSPYIIRQSALTAEDVTFISDIFEAEKLDYMIQHPIPENHIFAYRHFRNENTYDNPDFFKRIALYQEFSYPLDDLKRRSFGPSAQLITVFPCQTPITLFHQIRKLLSGYTVIRSTSPLDGASFWIEIFPSTVSKSLTAKWLTEKLNIDIRFTMAVGNDYNDTDLLDWAHKSYVVENAPNDLKMNYDIVSSNNHGGVAEAIRLWRDNLKA